MGPIMPLIFARMGRRRERVLSNNRTAFNFFVWLVSEVFSFYSQTELLLEMLVRRM